MTAGESTQIGVAVVLTLTLAAVLWYACETRKMGREMKLSRQDGARPVLDIQEESLVDRRPEPIEAISEAVEEMWKHSLWCRLRNIGRGPALNIRAQIQQDLGIEQQILGTLGVGDEGEHRPFAILEASASEYFLRPGCQDVHSRWFWSRRQVTFDETGPHLGLLDTGEGQS